MATGGAEDTQMARGLIGLGSGLPFGKHWVVMVGVEATELVTIRFVGCPGNRGAMVATGAPE